MLIETRVRYDVLELRTSSWHGVPADCSSSSVTGDANLDSTKINHKIILSHSLVNIKNGVTWLNQIYILSILKSLLTG